METLSPLLFASIAIIIAMLLKPVERKIHIPYPVLLVIAGFTLSEVYISLGFDTGVRASNFYWLSQYIFIPIIVFSSAFHISPKLLVKESLTHFMFAIPIALITLLVTAAGLYYGIGHPTGFPWIAAFLTAAALSATGAHAIADYLEMVKVPEKIIMILQFEALFTGILAIVFFNLFLAMALMPGTHTLSYWSLDFLMLVTGGTLIGVIVSYIVLSCIAVIKNSLAQSVLVFSAVFFAYFLAEVWQVSGGVAVFCMGFMLGTMAKKHFKSENQFNSKLWDFYYLLAIGGIFMLVGVTITTDMFLERWLAMVIGIAAILAGRSIGVFTNLGIKNLCHIGKPYSFQEQSMLVLTGMRAALPIALAFAIPIELDYWWTIQSIVFGVVLFTLIIQAPLVCLLWVKCFR